MTTRRAKLEDASRLSGLHRRAFEKSWSQTDFENWLRRDMAFCSLAEHAGRVVALGVALEAGDDAELLTLASHPGRRRKGMAREVLAHLDAEASKRGLKRWILEVACNNVPALALYRSLNFVEIGVRKGYYAAGADQFDGFVLARPVGLASGWTGGHGSE